jgi:hypothetical protein
VSAPRVFELERVRRTLAQGEHALTVRMDITDPGSISTARDERPLSAGGAAVAFGFIL